MSQFKGPKKESMDVLFCLTLGKNLQYNKGDQHIQYRALIKGIKYFQIKKTEFTHYKPHLICFRLFIKTINAIIYIKKSI